MIASDEVHRAVQWKEVGLFIGLTFVLTYGWNAVMWFTVGYGSSLGTSLMLQTQMLLPASVAFALGLFIFRDNPLFEARRRREPAAWFALFFLFFTLVYIVLSILAAVSYDFILLNQIAVITQFLPLLGLLVFFIMRMRWGAEPFARVGLGGAPARWWLLFGLGIVAYYGLQTALNALFGLGQPVDVVKALGLSPEQAGTPGMSPLMLTLTIGIQALIIGPFLGLMFGLGEEYGWRGYLQSALIPLGKVRGIALLGVIWGVWHAPVIAMGHNYPGHPVLGILVMTAYTVGLAFVLGYAVLKTGSIWLAAFLHALNNQTASFFMALVYEPADALFSFGIGIYALIPLAIVVALLLFFDPVWRSEGRLNS